MKADLRFDLKNYKPSLVFNSKWKAMTITEHSLVYFWPATAMIQVLKYDSLLILNHVTVSPDKLEKAVTHCL